MSETFVAMLFLWIVVGLQGVRIALLEKRLKALEANED